MWGDRTMARVLILLTDGFDDAPVTGLEAALQEEGHEVVFVGTKRGATVTGKSGTERVCDLDPLHVNLAASHAVVIPGGPGADALLESSQMVNVVYSVVHKGRFAVAIGRGVRMLPPVAKQKSPNPVETGTKIVQGELLKGRSVTGDPEVQEELEKAGALWQHQGVCVDGPWITANLDREGALERLVDEMVPFLVMAERPVVSQIL